MIKSSSLSRALVGKLNLVDTAIRMQNTMVRCDNCKWYGRQIDLRSAYTKSFDECVDPADACPECENVDIVKVEIKPESKSKQLFRALQQIKKELAGYFEPKPTVYKLISWQMNGGEGFMKCPKELADNMTSRLSASEDVSGVECRDWQDSDEQYIQ